MAYEDLLLLLLDFVWFPLVKTFIINWGKSMVPHGMRWDLNDVQRRFQLPQYEWPPNDNPDDDVIAYIRRHQDSNSSLTKSTQTQFLLGTGIDNTLSDNLLLSNVI